jgi:type 1 fimbria pilin
MKRSILSGVFVALGVLFAHEPPQGKVVTVTGQVIDTGCYIAGGAQGAEHAACAATCAKAGVPLAIVDAGGKIYVPIATDHKNQNVRLMPFIEKKVKVSGTLLEKGGVTGIAIKTVEAAD